MAIYTKFSRTSRLAYSNENASASFYKWLQDLFDHPDGYSVIFDKELGDPENKQVLPLPCIVVNQMDTSEPGAGFLGADSDKNSCLFYVYCIVDKKDASFGSVRLLRRMKDQIVFALKKAGIFDHENSDLVVEPIKLYDFGQSPPAELSSTLTLNTNITQHFTDEGDILQYELVISFSYLIEGKLNGA